MAEQVEERLGTLVTLLADQGVPLGGVTQRVVVGHDEVVVFLADHLGPGRTDRGDRRSDIDTGWRLTGLKSR